MYKYTEQDQRLLDERVAQYRGQMQRYLAGELSEEEFLPLRLQNGLYVQRYAPMLRVAIPYGLMSTEQVRMLAHISRKYDKGYVHISTRQNIQFNWPLLESTPDILDELASVQMHAIQTSGNCIRNTTTDQFSGVAADEVDDPRPWCEIIRQWSTFHPEFAYLPRKFKIAVASSTQDRAAIALHDIGIQLIRNEQNELRCRILVGGGLGRTPVVGTEIHPDLEPENLLSYLDAILRVYNQHGRRDNKYKARIKILVKATGIDKFRDMVNAEWENIKDTHMRIPQEEMDRVKACFPLPAYKQLDNSTSEIETLCADNPRFRAWYRTNVTAHKQNGYACVTLSLKKTGIAPGDVTDTVLDQIADLADEFSMGEVRNTHQQNMVLADVEQQQLFALWGKLDVLNLATPNIGMLTDMICCPGGDFCALANAKSLPIAEAVQKRFDNLDYLYDIGELDLNISGCMNACGHHHIGHIGILGVDKKGREFYQIQIGGDGNYNATLGAVLGPSFNADEIPDVIEKLITVYTNQRVDGERFIETYRRIGKDPFKESVYAKAN